MVLKAPTLISHAALQDMVQAFGDLNKKKGKNENNTELNK